jgi:hypothetical protein
VTALNKSRASERLQVSYEGTLAQCVVLSTEQRVRQANDQALCELVGEFGAPGVRRKGSLTHVWSSQDNAEAVCRFLESFQSPMGTNGFDARRIAQFIGRQQARRELVDWTVALISANGGLSDNLAGLDVALVKRKNVAEGKDVGKFYVLPNSNVLNPPDQGIDLEGQSLDASWVRQLLGKRAFGEKNVLERGVIERAEGLQVLDVALEISRIRYQCDKDAGRIRATQLPPDRPYGAVLRDMRKTSNGLLLLYPLDAAEAGISDDKSKSILTCVLSFPTSETAVPIEYQVNEVYRQLHLDQVEDSQQDEQDS